MGNERFDKFRVVLKHGFNKVPWVSKRMGHGYLTLRPGMTGIVVCETMAGDKYGVQFDSIIWNDSMHESKMNNGCHGKGELHRCIYLYKEYFKTDDDRLSKYYCII